MTDKDDERLAALYRQSSQEQPPARLDRAVLEAARRAVRPRPASPFGNYWMVAGTFATVALVGVILVSLWHDRGDLAGLPAAVEEAALPAEDSDRIERRVTQPDAVEPPVRQPDSTGQSLPRQSSGTRRERQTAPGDSDQGTAQQRDARPLPEMLHESLTDGIDAPATRTQDAANFWLEAGTFTDFAAADELRHRLDSLQLPVEIGVVQVDSSDRWQVRIGPLPGADKVGEVRKRLDAQGISSRLIVDGE